MARRLACAALLIVLAVVPPALGKPQLRKVCPLLTRADVVSIMGRPAIERRDFPMAGVNLLEGGCEWRTREPIPGEHGKPAENIGLTLDEWHSRTQAKQYYEGSQQGDAVACHISPVSHAGDRAYHCFNNVTFLVGRFVGKLSAYTRSGQAGPADARRAITASRRIARRLPGYR